jgi:CBS-domain-containing membrane protein
MSKFKETPVRRLTLRAETAADLMTPNPVSIRASATIPEAVALFTDKGIGAAPVIDDQTGRAVGIVSQTDILVHDREMRHFPEPVAAFYNREDLSARPGVPPQVGSCGERNDPTLVRDIMTPIVFSVALDSPAAEAVEQLVALKIHRLFVVDEEGVLIGVISAVDVLKRLVPE